MEFNINICISASSLTLNLCFFVGYFVFVSKFFFWFIISDSKYNKNICARIPVISSKQLYIKIIDFSFRNHCLTREAVLICSTFKFPESDKSLLQDNNQSLYFHSKLMQTEKFLCFSNV